MTGKCTDDYPKTDDYYNDLSDDPMVIVFLVFGTILAAASLVNYAEEYVFLRRTYKRDHLKVLHLATILGLYPVVTVMSSVSLLVPTSTELVDFVTSCYLSLCIYTFVHMMIDYFGGHSAMVHFFSDIKINPNTPPCCCCCWCICKPLTLTKFTLRRFELLAMQVCLVQPVILFVELILWTDGKGDDTFDFKKPMVYLMITTTCSTLFSMYGMIVIFRASRPHLLRFRIIAKFLCVQLPVVILNLQRFVFNGLSVRNIPACLGNRGSQVRASVLNHGLLTIEFFLLTILARFAFRISEDKGECTALKCRDEKITPYTSEASSEAYVNTTVRIDDMSGSSMAD